MNKIFFFIFKLKYLLSQDKIKISIEHYNANINLLYLLFYSAIKKSKIKQNLINQVV